MAWVRGGDLFRGGFGDHQTHPFILHRAHLDADETPIMGAAAQRLSLSLQEGG